MTRSDAPAASSVRFALLIATVLATSAFIFLSISIYLPSKQPTVSEAVDACLAAQEADPDFTAPVVTPENAARVARRFQACINQALRDEAIFMVVGFGGLFGLAALLYLAHPWWIVRRRKLRRLPAGPLLDDLEQLSREMGLSRSPDWGLARLPAPPAVRPSGCPGIVMSRSTPGWPSCASPTGRASGRWCCMNWLI